MANHILEYAGRIVGRLRMIFVLLSGSALLVLTFMITADTFFRYVFNAPFPASVEISQLIQPYVVFLPFAFAMSTGTHVRVTLLTDRITGKARRFLDVLPFICGTVFFGIMTYVSWLKFWESFIIHEKMLAAVTLYWWVGKMAMPLGMVVITIECVYQFLFTLANPPVRDAKAGM